MDRTLNNRYVVTAIGVVAIFLGLRWFVFGGDGFLFLESIGWVDPPDDNTKVIPFASVVGPMLWEAVIIVGLVVIAFTKRLVHFAMDLPELLPALRERAQQIRDGGQGMPRSAFVANPSKLPSSLSGLDVQSPSVPAALDPAAAAVLPEELMRAVASGDGEAVQRAEHAIRLPYAIDDVASALEAGRFDDVVKLVNEVAGLTGSDAIIQMAEAQA